MRSRIETGKVLREGKVPVTEFRAGVITGSGSISFEMIRFMTELFPIVPGPMWMKNKSQPIATQNVIDYLFAALDNKNGQGQVFEIGGPEVSVYKDLMLQYAKIRGLKRRAFLLPGIPLWFMAFGVGLMTPVPYPIAYALLGGLSADSIVKHPEALKVFPEVKLIDFDSATQKALKITHPIHIERIWVDGDSRSKSLKHEGCFINHREVKINSVPENIFRTILNFVNQQHGWQVESNETNSRMIVCNENRRFGDQWIEWRVDQSHLSQTVFFAPRGMLGFLYWYLLMPFHHMRFHGLISDITRQAAK
jgi:hypothetical protein